MKVKELIEVIDGQLLTGEDKLDLELMSACGSDMMSDVLAFVKDQSVLLTGLVNPQVVRTAEMMDMYCIVFVRGKTPDSNVIELAKNKGIVVICSKLRLYEACGKLYVKGLGVASND